MLIHKVDGAIHLCVDFLIVNAVLKLDTVHCHILMAGVTRCSLFFIFSTAGFDQKSKLLVESHITKIVQKLLSLPYLIYTQHVIILVRLLKVSTIF